MLFQLQNLFPRTWLYSGCLCSWPIFFSWVVVIEWQNRLSFPIISFKLLGCSTQSTIHYSFFFYHKLIKSNQPLRRLMSNSNTWAYCTLHYFNSYFVVFFFLFFYIYYHCYFLFTNVSYCQRKKGSARKIYK